MTSSTIPQVSPPSASASIPSARWLENGLEKQLAFSRDLKAPSCIHVNETGTIDRLHAGGLLGPDLLVIHGNLITNGELELMAKARMPLCFTPTADTQGTPADVVRRAIDRGVEVVFGCDIPCSIASDPIGQLRVMFNVQGFLDGAMERSFSTVVGRRPAVRPGLPLLTPRRLLETATIGTARVLGLDDRIGSLTPGKRADIVLIRKGPFGDSVARDACAHVLLQTSPRDIDTVLVDGESPHERRRAGRLRSGKSGGDDPRVATAHPGLSLRRASETAGAPRSRGRRDLQRLAHAVGSCRARRRRGRALGAPAKPDLLLRGPGDGLAFRPDVPGGERESPAHPVQPRDPLRARAGPRPHLAHHGRPPPWSRRPTCGSRASRPMGWSPVSPAPSLARFAPISSRSRVTTRASPSAPRSTFAANTICR